MDTGGRASGRGSCASFWNELRAIAQKLEAERPETAENDEERTVREKRIGFYERLGYVAYREIDYEVYHVPMWLMVHPLGNPLPSARETADAMRGFYSYAKGLPLRTSLFREE